MNFAKIEVETIGGKPCQRLTPGNCTLTGCEEGHQQLDQSADSTVQIG